MTDTLVTEVVTALARRALGASPPLRVGTDLVDLAAFSRHMELGGTRFLDRVFLPQELAFSKGRLERLAARFAAKEAASKALGTGMRGVGWHDFEVRSQASGEPMLHLHHRARARADELRVSSIVLSLTHTATAALAVAIAIIDPLAEKERTCPEGKSQRRAQ